jgi:hypothetical protein
MKHIYTLIFISFFSCATLNSQVIDIVTGLWAPIDILEYDNNLYISEVFSGTILKIDLTATQPIATIYVTGLSEPTGLERKENYLYIAEGDAHKISKIDLSSPNPIPTDVVTGLVGVPTATLVNGNDLYIAERVSNKITKIDLNSPNPIPIDVATGVEGPHSLALHGNDLYISERWASKISKIDITSTLPATPDLVTWVNGYKILLINDELYISNLFQNKISRINIIDTNPIVEDVLEGIIGPIGLEFKENDLYISQNTGKISKVDIDSLPLILGLADNNLKKISIYPNPSNDFIKISGITETKSYTIYNVLGLIINTGFISNNEIIDIHTLSSGLYFIKFDNDFTQKFIKK